MSETYGLVAKLTFGMIGEGLDRLRLDAPATLIEIAENREENAEPGHDAQHPVDGVGRTCADLRDGIRHGISSTFHTGILVTFLDRPRRSEHFVPMKVFGDRLRERAGALAVSHAEVARRAGLSDRRYSNYVTGRTEPDLATLVRIAIALETSPDALLGVQRASPSTKRSALVDRLTLAAEALSDDDVELVIVQTVALAGWRQRDSKGD